MFYHCILIKDEEAVRVNFDNVVYYHAKGEQMTFTFLAPKYHKEMLTLKHHCK
ncbi:hypothetical protein ACFQRK_23195 [Parapedobacter sp. GCM10030251]|uniref:hypothetical protein n=1 Tax=Parapedobacter sp. GCM10030251 TaxID=3273419 RepID=UPI00361954DA